MKPQITAFQNQLRQLKEDAARDAGAPYTKDPRFNRLLTNAGGGGVDGSKAR